MVSCPASTFCVAINTQGKPAGAAYTWQDGHWSRATTVDTRGLSAVSCATRGILPPRSASSVTRRSAVSTAFGRS